MLLPLFLLASYSFLPTGSPLLVYIAQEIEDVCLPDLWNGCLVELLLQKEVAGRMETGKPELGERIELFLYCDR